MKDIFIKYNPYKVTTEISIDKKPVLSGDELYHPDQRLQEWIEYMPAILVNKFGNTECVITFQGTLPDYEDVYQATIEAEKLGLRIIKRNFIPAKEYKDKERAIETIFNDIQKGPIAELKDKDIIRAFELAKSRDFEVNVIATMSAGKSTLINAFLGKKLMPAKQEACTATITEIHDNDINHFEAEVFDKNGKRIDMDSSLSYETMNKWNSQEEVSRIRIKGDIPFVEATDNSLVLIDTPGPNNSRDPAHRVTTYTMLSESSKTLVLYILNSTQLGVDDDDRLLTYVAESMKVGGKQSRDRFIFVVNKMDEFWKDEDSVEAALQKVRKYLAEKGIENPNIYPASAITALSIRDDLKEIDDMSSDDDGEVEVEEAKKHVRLSVKKEKLHFEKYAPLSLSAQERIKQSLLAAEESGNKKEQALIHSGIISIEEAIRTYVLKYAKTAKIKNISDTISRKLESQKTFDTLMASVLERKEESEKVLRQVDEIEHKLHDVDEAKKFKKKIESINFDDEIRADVSKRVKKAEKEMTEQLQKIGMSSQMDREQAEKLCVQLTKEAEDILARLKCDLERMVNNNIKKNSEKITDEYIKRIKGFSDVAVNLGELSFDSFKLVEGKVGNLVNMQALLDDAEYESEVYEVTGHHVVFEEVFGARRTINAILSAFNISPVFEVKYHLENDYDWVKKKSIDAQQLMDQFVKPIIRRFDNSKEAAIDFAKKNTAKMQDYLYRQFEKIDAEYDKKLKELKACSKDKDASEKRLHEAYERLNWLNSIQSRIDEIMEI